MVILRLSNHLEIENPPATLEKWLEEFCIFHTSTYSNNDDIPETIILFERNGNKISIPRGLTELVIGELNKLKIEFQLEDLTTQATHYAFKIKKEINYTTGVFGFQKKVVNQLKSYHTGRLEAPTGSGKTALACLLIGELQEGPILFLVNKDRLLRQFISTVTKVLGIPKDEIGIIKAAKYSIKPITVGSLQTLGKEKFDLEAIKNSFNTVFFDECHISTALTYRRVLLALAPKRLIGLSATPDHYFSKSLNNLMLALLGPVKVKVEESEVPGRIIPEAYTRETNLVFTYRAAQDSPEWMKNKCRNKLFNELLNSRERNKIIFHDCRKLVSVGHKVLIAVARVSHGKILYDALTKAGLLASFPYKIKEEELYTVDHKKLDEDCFKIENGELSILIGTYSLFQTGFDCKALSAIQFAAPFSGINTTAVKQAVGRILRHTFDKESAVVIDYLDDSKPFNILRQWGEDRAEVLDKESKKNHSFIK